MSDDSPAFTAPNVDVFLVSDDTAVIREAGRVPSVLATAKEQILGGVEFADAPKGTSGGRSSGLLDFLFKKSSGSMPVSSQQQLQRRRISELRWACPTCAHVNTSDVNATCAQCCDSFPALLVDRAYLSLPPSKRISSLQSMRNSVGGVAAGALLGPIGLATAAAAAAGANIANIRFKEAIRCEEVRLQVRALAAEDPMRGVRAVLRRGGGLGPDEVKFLAARDTHVAAHLPVFIGLEEEVNPSLAKLGSNVSLLEMQNNKCPSSEAKEVPLRIAIAVSGGGLRAMTCHLAAMQVAKNSGLLDCCTYVAGLSGSCWSLGAWYADAVKLVQQQQDSSVSSSVPSSIGRAGAEANQDKGSMRCTRDTGFVALDMTVENIRCRVHRDLRYPPAAWLGDCRKEWIAARFAARKAQGLDLSSSDLFGGNIANYLLGDVDCRGTTLSEQRSVFEDGGMPMPVYTCVRKDVENERAQDWMPDDASNVCLICGVEWSHFAGIFAPASQARHHCRSCGRLVCGACSTNRAAIGHGAATKASPTDVTTASHENVMSDGAVASATSAGSAEAVADVRPRTDGAKDRVRVCDDCYREKRHETSKKKQAKNWWQWWEFNPFEVGALSPSSFRSSDAASIPQQSASNSSSSNGNCNRSKNAILLRPACPAWAFGRVFHDGVCLGVAPGGECSLGLLLGVFGAAFNATWEHVYDQIAPSMPQALNATLHSWTDKYHGGHLVAPAVFHDFRRISPRLPPLTSLHKEEKEEEERSQWTCSTCSFANSALLPECEMCLTAAQAPPPRPSPPSADAAASAPSPAPPPFTEGSDDDFNVNSNEKVEEVPPLLPLTDAGLDFNFPIVPLLRPEREVDVLLVLDHSQYDPGAFTHSHEWAKATEYCQRNQVPLPQSFDASAVAAKPLTVFPGDAQKGGAPTLIVLHTNVMADSNPPPTTHSNDGAASSKGGVSSAAGFNADAAAAMDPDTKAKTTKEYTAFAPLENAKAGGYCDLSTLKYSKSQFDELFAFGVEHFEKALPQIKAALRDATALKKEKQMRGVQ